MIDPFDGEGGLEFFKEQIRTTPWENEGGENVDIGECSWPYFEDDVAQE